jgi:hypothetical protein
MNVIRGVQEILTDARHLLQEGFVRLLTNLPNLRQPIPTGG